MMRKLIALLMAALMLTSALPASAENVGVGSYNSEYSVGDNERRLYKGGTGETFSPEGGEIKQLMETIKTVTIRRDDANKRFNLVLPALPTGITIRSITHNMGTVTNHGNGVYSVGTGIFNGTQLKGGGHFAIELEAAKTTYRQIGLVMGTDGAYPSYDGVTASGIADAATRKYVYVSTQEAYVGEKLQNQDISSTILNTASHAYTFPNGKTRGPGVQRKGYNTSTGFYPINQQSSKQYYENADANQYVKGGGVTTVVTQLERRQYTCSVQFDYSLGKMEGNDPNYYAYWNTLSSGNAFNWLLQTISNSKTNINGWFRTEKHYARTFYYEEEVAIDLTMLRGYVQSPSLYETSSYGHAVVYTSSYNAPYGDDDCEVWNTNMEGRSRTFHVTMPSQGMNLTVENYYPGDYDEEFNPVFLKYDLVFQKTLANATLADKQFTFELLRKGQVIATAQNDASGKIVFPIQYDMETLKSSDQYTESSLTWGFDYTVREVNGGDAGIVYDATERKAHVDVQMSGVTQGNTSMPNFSARVTYSPNGSNTFQNTKIETVSITVQKDWQDGNDRDRIRPASVQVQLYRNGTAVPAAEGGVQTLTADMTPAWSYTWGSLRKYDDNKRLISYSVTELTKLNDYTVSYQSGSNTDGKASIGSNDQGTVIVRNSHALWSTSITIKKVWDDGDDQDGLRGPVTFTLDGYWSGWFGSSYHWYAETITLDGKVDAIEQQPWTCTLNDLPPCTYWVAETVRPDGYDEPIYASGANTDGKVSINSYNQGAVSITNHRTPDTVSLTVTKDWQDANNQDGHRKADTTVTVRLWRKVGANGRLENCHLDKTLGPDNWTATWQSLPKRSGGTEIFYSLQEPDCLEGYTPEYPNITFGSNGSASVTLTNRHEPAKVSVQVIKTWKDGGGANSTVTPETDVRVQLCKTVGGVEADVGAAVSLPHDTWSYQWDNLPKYEAGQLIAYTVKELGVPAGYATNSPVAATFTGSVGAATLINTRSDTRDVTIRKEWKGDESNAYQNQKEITVALLRDDMVIYDNVKLNSGNHWAAKWNNLPKYNDEGKLYVYTAQEKMTVDGYESRVDELDEATGEIVITNTLKTQSIRLVKVWDDASDQDGARPNSVTLRVTSGSATLKEVTLTAPATTGDRWTTSYFDVPLYYNNQPVTLSIDETTPAGYEKFSAVFNTATRTGTVTNRHIPATVSIAVTKTWTDAGDLDGLRPATGVQVRLYRNNEPVADADGGLKTLIEPDWSASWDALPKFADGAEIAYKVEEITALTDYGVAYLSGTSTNGAISFDATGAGAVAITNSHTPYTYDFVVKYENEFGEVIALQHKQSGLKKGDNIATYTMNSAADNSLIPEGYEVLNVAESAHDGAAAGFYAAPEGSLIGAFSSSANKMPGRDVEYVVTLAKVNYAFQVIYTTDDGSTPTDLPAGVSKTLCFGDTVDVALGNAPVGYQLTSVEATTPGASEAVKAADKAALYKTDKFDGSMPSHNVTFTVTFTREQVPYIIRYWDGKIQYQADGATPDATYQLGADITGTAAYGRKIGVNGVNATAGDVQVDGLLRRPVGYDTGTYDATFSLGAAGLAASDNVYNVIYQRNTFGYTVRYWNYAPNDTDGKLLATITTGKALLGTKVGIPSKNPDAAGTVQADLYLNVAPYQGFDGNNIQGDALLKISADESRNVYNVWYLPLDYTFAVEYVYEAPTGVAEQPAAPALPENHSETPLHWGDPITAYTLNKDDSDPAKSTLIPAGYVINRVENAKANPAYTSLYSDTLRSFGGTMPAENVTYKVYVRAVPVGFTVTYTYPGKGVDATMDSIMPDDYTDPKALYTDLEISGYALNDGDHTLPAGYEIDTAAITATGASVNDFLTGTVLGGTMPANSVAYLVPIKPIDYRFELVYATDDGSTPSDMPEDPAPLTDRHVGQTFPQALDATPEGYVVKSVTPSVTGATTYTGALNTNEAGTVNVTMPADHLKVTVVYTKATCAYTVHYWQGAKELDDQGRADTTSANYLGAVDGSGKWRETLGSKAGSDHAVALSPIIANVADPSEAYYAPGAPDIEQLYLAVNAAQNVIHVVYPPKHAVIVEITMTDGADAPEPTVNATHGGAATSVTGETPATSGNTTSTRFPNVTPGDGYEAVIPALPGYGVTITVAGDPDATNPGTAAGNVTGDMPKNDVIVHVTYTPIPLTFTVEYTFEGNGVAPAAWLAAHSPHKQGSATEALLKVGTPIADYKLNDGDHTIPAGYSISAIREIKAATDAAANLYSDATLTATNGTFSGAMPARNVKYEVVLTADALAFDIVYQYDQGVTGDASMLPVYNGGVPTTQYVGQTFTKTLGNTPVGYVVKSVTPSVIGAASYSGALLGTATAGDVSVTMPAQNLTVTVVYTYAPASYRVRYWKDAIGAAAIDPTSGDDTTADTNYLGTTRGNASARVHDLVGQTGTANAQYTFSLTDHAPTAGTQPDEYRLTGTATPTDKRLDTGDNIFNVLYVKNPTLTVRIVLTEGGNAAKPTGIEGTSYRVPGTDYDVAYPELDGYTSAVTAEHNGSGASAVDYATGVYAPITTKVSGADTHTVAQMPDEDVLVTITYTPIAYRFDVAYTYDANGTAIAQPALPTYAGQTFHVGGSLTDYALEDETVASFPIGFRVTDVTKDKGTEVYNAQTKLFSNGGVALPSGDIHYTVTIQPWPHTLTVHYLYEDMQTSAYANETKTKHYGDAVDHALQSAPTGYRVKLQGFGTPTPAATLTADGKTLSYAEENGATRVTGEMPNRDADFYVVYEKIPVTYVIRYWKDNMNASSQIGRDVAGEDGAKYGDTVRIAGSAEASTFQAPHLANMPDGYTQSGYATSPMGVLSLTDDADHNVFNIIYQKGAISFVVEYWQDATSTADGGTLLHTESLSGLLGDTVGTADGVTHQVTAMGMAAHQPIGYLPGTGDVTLTLTANAAHDVYRVLYLPDHYDFTVEYRYESTTLAPEPANLPAPQTAADEALYGASVSFANVYRPDGYEIGSIAVDAATPFVQDETAFATDKAAGTIAGSMPAHDVNYIITLVPTPLTFTVKYAFAAADTNHPTESPYDENGYTDAKALYTQADITEYAAQAPKGYKIASVAKQSGDAELAHAPDATHATDWFSGAMGTQSVVYLVTLEELPYTLSVTYQYESGVDVTTAPSLEGLGTSLANRHVGDAISVPTATLPDGYHIRQVADTTGALKDDVACTLTPSGEINTATYASGTGFGGAMPAASVAWVVTLAPNPVGYTVRYWKDAMDGSTVPGTSNYLGEVAAPEALYGKTLGPQQLLPTDPDYTYTYSLTALRPNDTYRTYGVPQEDPNHITLGLTVTDNVLNVVYLPRPDVYVSVTMDNGGTPPTIPGLSTAPDGTPGFSDVEPGDPYGVSGIPTVPGYDVTITVDDPDAVTVEPTGTTTGSVDGDMPQTDVHITIAYTAKDLTLTVDYMYNGDKQNAVPEVIRPLLTAAAVPGQKVGQAAHYDVPATVVTGLVNAGYGISLTGSKVTSGPDNGTFAATGSATADYDVDGTMPAEDMTYTLNILPLDLTLEVQYHFVEGEAVAGSILPDHVGPTTYHVGDAVRAFARGTTIGYELDHVDYNGAAESNSPLYDGTSFGGAMPAVNVKYDVYLRRQTLTYAVYYWQVDADGSGTPVKAELGRYLDQSAKFGDTVTAGDSTTTQGAQHVWARDAHRPTGYQAGSGDATLTLDQSGKIYNISYYKDSYAYTVRYWKQRVAMLGTGAPDPTYYIDAVTGTGLFGETVGDANATHQVSYTEFFSTLTGYQTPGHAADGQSNIAISANAAANVYDVVYDLADYSFGVRYAYTDTDKAAAPALPIVTTQTGLHYQGAITDVAVQQPEAGYRVQRVVEVASATDATELTTNLAGLYADDASTVLPDGMFTGGMPARDVYYIVYYEPIPLDFHVLYRYAGDAAAPTLPANYNQPDATHPALYVGKDIDAYALGAIPAGYEIESVTEVLSATDLTPVSADLANLYHENEATTAKDGAFSGAMPARGVTYLVQVIPSRVAFRVLYEYADKTDTTGLPGGVTLTNLYVGKTVESANGTQNIPLGTNPTGYEVASVTEVASATDHTAVSAAMQANLYRENAATAALDGAFSGGMPARDVTYLVVLRPAPQTYTVVYYKDSIAAGNELARLSDQPGRYGDTVSTATSTATTHHTVSNTANRPEGYQATGTGSANDGGDTLTLGVNNAANVYNVVYAKDRFDYTIDYWTDEITYAADGVTPDTAAANHLGGVTASGTFGQTLDFAGADITVAQATNVPEGYLPNGRKAAPTGTWTITADPAQNRFHVVYDPAAYAFRVRYAYEGPADAQPRTNPAAYEETGLRFGGIAGATAIAEYPVTGIPDGYEIKRVVEVISATEDTALDTGLANLYQSANERFSGRMPSRDVFYLVYYGPKALAFRVEYEYASTLAPAPAVMPADYAEPLPGSTGSLYVGKAITEYPLASIPEGYEVLAANVTTADGVSFYDATTQTFNGAMPAMDVTYTVLLTPIEYQVQVLYQYKAGMTGTEDVTAWNTTDAPVYYRQSVTESVHAAPTGYVLSSVTGYASPYVVGASAPDLTSGVSYNGTAITGTMPARSLTFVVEYELATVPYAIYYWTNGVTYLPGSAEPDLLADNLLGSVSGDSKYGYQVLDINDASYAATPNAIPMDRELFIKTDANMSKVYRLPGTATPASLTLGANGMTLKDNVIHVVYIPKPTVTVTVRIDEADVPAQHAVPVIPSPGYVDVDDPYTVVVPGMEGYTPTATTTDPDPDTIPGTLPGSIHQDQMPDQSVEIVITYTPNQYPYTVKYFLRENGADTYLGNDATGSAYYGTTLGDQSLYPNVTTAVDMTRNATSRMVTPGVAEPGYIAIGTGTNTLHVIYTPKPTLTVITTYTDGTKPDDMQTYPDRTPGDPYQVTAPDVTGYTPTLSTTDGDATVTGTDVTGTMPGTDVTVRIVYTPNNYAYRVEYYEQANGQRTLLSSYDGTAPYGVSVGAAATVNAAYRVDPYAAAQARHRRPYLYYSGDIVVRELASANLIVIVYELKPDVIVRVTTTDGSTPPVIPGQPSVNPGDPFDVDVPTPDGYTKTITVSSTDPDFDPSDYTVGTGDVTGTMPGEDVIIDVVYAPRTDLGYRVEYYYDGVQDAAATIPYTGVAFGTTVDTYFPKPRTGYRLQRVENLPLSVDTSLEANVVRVYYVGVRAVVIEDADIPLGAGTGALNTGDCAE